jgi:ankyrin repeat protein
MDMDLKGDEPDNEGKTPLHYVKSVEMLQALMEKTSAVTFFLQDKNEQTPLFTLMSYCKPYCADIALLENFLEYQPDLKLQDKNGFTVLHLAYDVDCAELLIKRGADVTMLSIYGENVLFKSVGTDQLGVGPFPKLAKFYLKNTEVDPYVVNKKGVSILGCIIGNKIDYKDVFLVHSDLFKEHLKRFHNGIDSNGDQILLTSLSKNDDFTLTFLLLKFDDIDVNIKSSDNSNLLHKLNFGSSRNAVQVARILIEKEVDINQSNDFGKTPLIQSVESSDTEKALFLMGLPKIDLDAQDLNGNTALHLAATCQNVRLICRLLIHGASSKIQNNEHKSFYHRLNNFNKSLFYFYDHPSNSL